MTEKKPQPRHQKIPHCHPPHPIDRIPLANLLNGKRELIIEHAGYDYHLRLTRNGKLLLTKEPLA